MPYSTYPSPGDVLRELQKAFPGLTLTANNTSCVEALAATIRELENKTRYAPFLSDGTDKTLYYSPDEILYRAGEMPMLDLKVGIVPNTTPRVITGVTSVSSGTEMVLNTDFFMRPSKAPLKSKPWTYIEFYSAIGIGFPSLGGYPNSIHVIAKVGWDTTVPDDVWWAVLRKTMAKQIPSILFQVNQGSILIREQDEELRFDSKPLLRQQQSWDDEFNQVCAAGFYRRSSVM